MQRDLIEALYFGEINETISNTFETAEYLRANKEYNRLYNQREKNT